ncbi:MAG: hypothetical protein Q9166_004675 [cf. Caloplaca sp. 2 TL-2023]
MAAIGLKAGAVEPYLTPGVILACENSGSSVIISRDDDVVSKTIAKVLSHQPDVLARKLKVEIAYHSHHMTDVGDLYESLIKGEFDYKDQSLTIPFYSSVTKEKYIDATSLGASYWRQNLESPVLFHSAVNNLLVGSGSISTFLEIGPHSALQGPLSRGVNSSASLLKSIGQLHCKGVPLDFEAINEGGTTLPNLNTYA